MSTIHTNIERWKSRLLDLSRRNQLINFRETKRSSLRLDSPSLEELYKMLVFENKTLSFPMPIDIEEDDDESRDQEAERIRSGNVQTNQQVREAQKTLRNLRHRSKTTIEEQGVNTLYASFGFLNWSEQTGNIIQLKSPIILVPVALTIESITSPFCVSLHDDEIVINPTLVHRLRHDYGIELPAFDSSDDKPTEYLARVRSIVATNRWEVRSEVIISPLSFLKINMYNDLERSKDRIKNHPLFKALSGESLAIGERVGLERIDHDAELRPRDTFHILDADSSQLDAIAVAKKGKSFVLQGPPGTGKSQTIANIISECLMAGQKVLFVSEKMAALEVVHRRLEQLGLADFCLPLHNHKAKRKEVIDSLVKTLESTRIRVKDEALTKLDQLEVDRTKLNRYVKEIHSRVEPLGLTPFEVHGQIASHHRVPDVLFSLRSVRDTSSQSLAQMDDAVITISGTLQRMKGDLHSNPWHESNVGALTHDLRQSIESRLARLDANLLKLMSLLDELEVSFGLVFPFTMRSTANVTEVLDTAAESPVVPLHWLVGDDLNEIMAEAQKHMDLQQRVRTLRRELDERFCASVYDLEAGRMLGHVRRCHDLLKPLLHESYVLKINTLLDNLDDLSSSLLQYHKQLRAITDLSDAAVQSLDCRGIQTLSDVNPHILLLRNLASCGIAKAEWFSRTQLRYVRSLLAMAKDAHRIVLQNKARFLTDFEADVFDIDASSLVQRFRTTYSTVTRYVKPSFWRDMRFIRTLAKDMTRKLTHQDAMAILVGVKETQVATRWLDEAREDLRASFGREYLGAETDWELMESSLGGIEGVLDYFDVDELPAETCEKIIAATRAKHKLAIEIRALEPFTAEGYDQQLSAYLKLDAPVSETLIRGLVKIVDQANPALLELASVLDKIKSLAVAGTSVTSVSAYSGLVRVVDVHLIQHEVMDSSHRLRELYAGRFSGLETDWERVIADLAWSGRFRDVVKKHNLPREFVAQVAEDVKTVNYLSEAKEHYQDIMDRANVDLLWFVGLFSTPERFLDLDLVALRARVQSCRHDLTSLEEWLDYRTAREHCISIGLQDMLVKMEEAGTAPELIHSAFRKRFFKLWLDSILPEFPVLEGFRWRNHEGLIQQFRALDREQFRLASSRIRAQLLAQLPDPDAFTSAKDEVGVLMREKSKQRRLMPLRKLFNSIPNLLPRLKPCLMMSPLSVSLFLENSAYEFDVVIFDEASQVCTEDAVGAIIRGKQVVIAGDRHQLPPTDFFNRRLDDGDYDFEEQEGEENSDILSEGYESILDEAVTVLPERTLRWHYRSRHEHLIAFSNAKIYDHGLITFPANIAREPDHGVEYVHVPEGIYDRSGRRDNSAEAARVAELVLQHIASCPNRSLGIVTFSERQQQAVTSAVRAMRLRNLHLEDFFSEGREEPFFIKNLENVQGDERDTIIFSIGYARDHRGAMYMNFGPLSRQGGHRRLNVAITRAKHNVKLVGSIDPTDIDLDRTNAEGVSLLRSYIEFAMTGPDALKRELKIDHTVSVESPFEEAVYDFLVSRGYGVDTQIGCSGYRIDMAIRHPTKSGRYVLGIECDGASYHSARTARERDRLRQDVLEGMGWTIHRIWSTDWIKDPTGEGKRLLERVDAILAQNGDLTVPRVINTTIRLDAMPVVREFDEAVVLESVKEPSQSGIEYFGLSRYVETVLPRMGLYGINKHRMPDAIIQVVGNESPIHFDLLCHRVMELIGHNRLSSKVKAEVSGALKTLGRSRVVMDGEFVMLPEEAKPGAKVRARHGGQRKVDKIHIKEIAEVMWVVADKSIGIDKAGMFSQTAALFGFARVGKAISSRFEEAYTLLVRNGRLRLIDEKVLANGE